MARVKITFSALTLCCKTSFFYSYNKEEEGYEVDIENLNSVEQVETPLCSASRLKEFEEDIKLSSQILTTPTMSRAHTNESMSQV